MKHILYPANSRGTSDHGWLKSKHSFSFAEYQNPERINFGALRVLNDDTVAAGAGFGTHPHNNMEIITIVLSGALEHKDSMGNIGVIRDNEVQVMSAGKGLQHSEYNHSASEAVTLFQIWIIPNERNVTPRYEQKQFDWNAVKNAWQSVVTSVDEKEGL
jgi:redox-sensitive bicupin YhaK (pirin superfamily)